jgi:hypothetical protein
MVGMEGAARHEGGSVPPAQGLGDRVPGVHAVEVGARVPIGGHGLRVPPAVHITHGAAAPVPHPVVVPVQHPAAPDQGRVQDLAGIPVALARVPVPVARLDRAVPPRGCERVAPQCRREPRAGAAVLCRRRRGDPVGRRQVPELLRAGIGHPPGDQVLLQRLSVLCHGGTAVGAAHLHEPVRHRDDDPAHPVPRHVAAPTFAGGQCRRVPVRRVPPRERLHHRLRRPRRPPEGAPDPAHPGLPRGPVEDGAHPIAAAPAAAAAPCISIIRSRTATTGCGGGGGIADTLLRAEQVPDLDHRGIAPPIAAAAHGRHPRCPHGAVDQCIVCGAPGTGLLQGEFQATRRLQQQQQLWEQGRCGDNDDDDDCCCCWDLIRPVQEGRLGYFLF